MEVAAGTIPPPLPPSVEEAYRKKCIELKRRMTEVEESNDAFRVRKARLTRGIRKMRLERAYLLETLGKRMKKNGSSIDGFQQAYDEESEGSSEGPPTPHEKPLRSKRSHRRPVSSPPPILGHQHPRPIAPSQAHPASAFEPPRDPFRESSFQHTPTTNGHTVMQYQPRPTPFPLHPTHPHDQQQFISGPPQPPQPAFDAFLENYIKPNYEEFPRRNDEELVHVARAAWENPYNKEYKDLYEEISERRLREYQQKLGEWEREREGERRDGQMEVEVQRELPPPPPPQQVQAPPAGVGGFTSING
ncbi:hypothetical protein ABVK25_003752 [Lepraria finkii]|uniref:HMG box domain-containing protein n=1 Tax=Lepraria finkii TaxID=1340010 RepID=A0ABR4BE44_9LECA